MNGWIKLHRKIVESPVFDNEKVLKVFIYCLTKASHKNHKQIIGTKVVELSPGQFIFGRQSWASTLKINESSIYRYMKLLEELDIITIKANNKFSVVTIVNWGIYQQEDNASEQQMNNKRTTNEQQMNTNNNVKNEKNEKNKDIVEYLNLKTKKQYKHTSKKTQSLINARLADGFTVDDFKTVIDKKTDEWINDERMNQYLRPETLFSNKFESYLNQQSHKDDTQASGFNLNDW